MQAFAKVLLALAAAAFFGGAVWAVWTDPDITPGAALLLTGVILGTFAGICFLWADYVAFKSGK